MIVTDLSIGYNSPIVNNINFSINPGDYVCVIGENGAGKSTLIKTILGLLPPLNGKIDKENCKIGYLPQQSNIQLDFPATVEEIVLSGCPGLFYTQAEKARARGNMILTGISKLETKRFSNLSGGQKQKVLLARALCAIGNSGLLVLDEPVNGLDQQSTKDMYDLVKKINKTGISVLMISHDKTALKYASHILEIKQSGVTFCDSSKFLSQGEM